MFVLGGVFFLGLSDLKKAIFYYDQRFVFESRRELTATTFQSPQVTKYLIKVPQSLKHSKD